MIDYNKHIWEGWTVQSFIDELSSTFNLIMQNKTFIKPFIYREEVKEWCMDNQPYYKKYIPEVVDHFCKEFNIK